MFALVLLAMLPSIIAAATETITWIHTDHLGSPIAGRNAAGETTWEQAYAPWGEKQAVAGLPQAPAGVGYTGHVYDEQVGLIYAGARWYDPEMGRLISPDPVDFLRGGTAYFSRYTYAKNNPYLYVDVNGESPTVVSGAIGAGIGFAIGAGVEGYQQLKAGQFDARALAVEGGKGFVVGGLIGLTGGAASGMGLSAQVATTGAVGVGVGAGAHSAGEVLKGNSAPSTGEALAVGVATGAGAVAGSAIGPLSSRITTTAIPAVRAYPVRSLRGRTFYTVNSPGRVIERPAMATAVNNIAAGAVEGGAKQVVEDH